MTLTVTEDKPLPYMVLGLDPGALRMGYAFVSVGDSYTLLDSGIIKTDRLPDEAYNEYRQRLVRYWTWHFADLWSKGDKIPMKLPDIIISETIPVIGKQPSQRILAHSAITACQVIAIRLGVPWRELGESTVKKAVTGRGRAGKGKKVTKVDVRNGVLKAFPHLESRKRELTDVADETDAIAVALCGCGYVVV